MILYISIANAQDCQYDVPRRASYECMEVYNYSTEKYEKFNNSDKIQTRVNINPKERLITLKDSINKYDKEFYINSCFVTDTSVVYNCLDIDKSKKCYLTFSNSKNCYILTVKYHRESVMFRMKLYK